MGRPSANETTEEMTNSSTALNTIQPDLSTLDHGYYVRIYAGI